MIQTSKNLLLKIENLMTYATHNGESLKIVDGLSFEIKKNEVVALFGKCGCGKTTTAHSIMGVVRYKPGVIAGTISFKGKVLMKNGKYDETQMKEVRGKKLFLVMQGAKSNLNPFWNIKKQIKYVSKKRMEEVEDILQKLCLGNMMKRIPDKLSGGECQRALLAMGLTSQSDLLIIDEPTVGIDEDLSKEVINLLREYKKGNGGNNSNRSLLLISHDLKIIEELADRIVVMRNGKIVETGDKETILKKPQYSYTKELISTLSVVPVKEESIKESIIKIVNVIKSFKDKDTPAVNEVSFNVNKGEFFGLVGRSGKGKTTLGKIILGLYTPDKGKGAVWVNGKNIAEFSDKKRGVYRKEVGVAMVFQHPDATLNPGMTIRQSIREIRREITDEEIKAYFEEVNLQPAERFFNLYPEHLSGGEKRRVALIQSLMVKPKILIADELFSGVDSIVRNAMANLLKKMKEKEKLTLILISHEREIIDCLCDSGIEIGIPQLC